MLAANIKEKDSQISRKKDGKYHRYFWMFIIPGMAFFSIFFLLPLFLNVFYSFTNFDGYKTIDFIGFKNYISLFNDQEFFASLLRTFRYAIFNLPFRILLPMIAAAMLSSKRIAAKSFTRTLFYFPVLLSALVVGITINWMFSQDYGLVNFLVEKLGGSAIEWGTNGILATIVVSVAGCWAQIGFFMVIYIGAINSISPEIYESANMDGANTFQTFIRITLPLLAPTTFLVTLLSTIGLLKEYTLVQGITQGGPGTKTSFIIQFIFGKGISQGQYGYSSAASMVVMVVFALISFIQFRISERK